MQNRVRLPVSHLKKIKQVNMIFNSGQKYSCDIIGEKVIIEIKSVNISNNRLMVDTTNEYTGKIISKNIPISLSDFRNSLNQVVTCGFKNLKELNKKPICISDVNFKNGQIEDEGAYDDDL